LIKPLRLLELPWESALGKVDFIRVLPESSLLVTAKLAAETGLSLKIPSKQTNVAFCEEDPSERVQEYQDK
jgi:hypothetical protein